MDETTFTKLMEDFLDEIIDESSYSSYERAIEPVGKDDYFSKIEISNYRLRNFIYTTVYLLKNSKNVTQLCIKTKAEFRLFKELNRLYGEISIETDDSIDNESKIKAFNIDDVKIIVDDENIMSVIGEIVIKVSKTDFIKKPIKSIKVILQK